MRRSLVLLLSVPLALAACGGSSDNGSAPPVKGDPVAYVRKAAHKTAQAASEHMTMTGTVKAAGHTVSLNGRGDFSNANGQGSMAAKVSAAGTYGEIDEVLDGTTIYMSSPSLLGPLPSGKTWMKLDLEKAYASQGINFSSLMSQSPEQGLQRLQAAGTVTTVGTETIGGVETTHFRVTNIDLSKVPQGAKIEALTHASYGAMNAWVDQGDGYVRRLSQTFSYSVKGQSVSTATVYYLSKFGEPVKVNVPPSAQTFDATKAATKGLGG